jgi:hypothetical protein
MSLERLERLSRAQLLRRVRELEAISTADPKAAMVREQELHAQQEEIQTQAEQLRQTQQTLALSR